MIFIGVALYISKQLNTGIRWIWPYQLFLLWLFFFFLPYFQIKETKTFHAIEHKLHTALKQGEHFNIYLLTPAFYHLLPELCFFSYWVHVTKQPHLINTSRVVVAGGAGQWDPDDSTDTQASMKTTWTSCDSSEEAFLTCGIVTSALCCAPAPVTR